MKTAISISDSLFKDADSLAKSMGVTRSRLYSQAVEEFVSIRKGRSVREALDAVYSRDTSGVDAPLAKLQSKAVKEDW